MTRVSACLLSWKRPANLGPIVRSLEPLGFVDEILVWNNDPSRTLHLPGAKVRVLSSPRNEGCYGRFLCARHARNDLIYVQDDDALVMNVPELLEHFLRDPTRIAHALRPHHFRRRSRSLYGACHQALLGWGAFFRKEWLAVLDELPTSIKETELFRREADKYFTILLERHHRSLPGHLEHLDGHSTGGEALWLEDDHSLKTALAVREALALVRRRRAHPPPLPWHVVIPCYDYGRYLREAVTSVLHNDADYEVTIVDDASSDETPEVGRRLAAEHAHVTYRRLEENVGPGAALNRAIAARESIFVVRLDADDRMGPDYLHQAEAVLSDGADVANPDAILFGDREDRWPVPETTTLSMLLKRNPVHCASAFRRSYWARVGGFDEEMEGWEDYELWIRMAAAEARIRRVPGDHFYYRKHGPSRDSRAAVRADLLRGYIRRKHRALYRREGRNRAS